jgi:N-acetylglucosaminyl-diphospho-decaprenol L-rhamnosyltransferase
MPELSIIIVNWNSISYVRECLASILKETCGFACDVVVVDNASDHDDISELAAEFPSIRLLSNRHNVGFACANNIGFRETGAPYVLFLNPDTRVLGDALGTMLSVMKQYEDAGVVGCRLLNADCALQTSCVQRFPRVLNQALSADILHTCFPRLPLWGLQPLLGQSQSPIPVEAVSGACLMVRREAFEQAGLFSEEYFMYAEDVDLCYKVTRAGWRCYHVPGATVIHYGGGSSRRQSVNSWAAVMQCGAKLRFVCKTRGSAYACLYQLAIAISAAFRWVLLALAAPIQRRGENRERLQRLKTKWAAIFRWSLRPGTTLRRLAVVEGEVTHS